jgi:hypothetical protein
VDLGGFTAWKRHSDSVPDWQLQAFDERLESIDVFDANFILWKTSNKSSSITIWDSYSILEVIDNLTVGKTGC